MLSKVCSREDDSHLDCMKQAMPCDRPNGKRDQALEWVSANELEDKLQAVGQSGASPGQHGQGAAPECGHLSSSAAGAPGCSIPQDIAGTGCFHAAFLSVPSVPQTQAPGTKLKLTDTDPAQSPAVWHR